MIRYLLDRQHSEPAMSKYEEMFAVRARQQVDAGYSNDGRWTGCDGSRLISAFSALPGVK